MSLNSKLSSLERLPKVHQWVLENIELLQPSDVHVCSGSEEEYQTSCDKLVKKGSFIKLNEEKRPNSYLARSDPKDVARVEANTYICSKLQSDSGPTNNWMDPEQMKATLKPLFTGCMKGRTMYVIPYCMGPIGSPLSKIGFELSDSEYVVVNMNIMTHMGSPVLDALKEDDDFVKGVHSVGFPLPEGTSDVAWPCNSTKYIVHFPEEQSIYSFGSGYGGNALLGKKCFALRIASNLGRKEGWLAEHMLIVGATNPEGVKKYYCAAFPSQCGKTNMAMMQPSLPGWKVEVVGDDIAWLRPGKDGKLYAINPESGFFGVAPGTNYSTNPNAMLSMQKDSIFTNVGLTDDGDVWWEGLGDAPSHCIDWRGNDWTPESTELVAHPNSRFTSRVVNCPILDPSWSSTEGVPIDAILFGGRRKYGVPLVVESLNWTHSTYIGATVSSAQTAAAEGVVGALRHDPFAMLPFCGYNMGDYFSHWLGMEKLVSQLPKVYLVNWFRVGKDGKYLWPGFGENIRVLSWISKRIDGTASAIETPIGFIPKKEDLELPEGFTSDQFDQLFQINNADWKLEIEETKKYFSQFGDKFPSALTQEMEIITQRLSN